MKVGIEVGGTFTDLIVVADDGRVLQTGKIFSTPANPALAVLEALALVEGQPAGGVTLVHGSTVATNAVLERKGPRVGLLATEGFRDLLELQRQDRQSIYDIHFRKPAPLVSREDALEVPERIGPDGEVVRPLDEAAAAAAIRALVTTRGIRSIAVSFLHAYKNPDHERRVGALIRSLHPEVSVSLSSAVNPEFREFERTSTTAVDAFVKPIIDRYVSHLEAQAAGRRVRDLWIMESNGGILPAPYAREHAVRTLLSGPAAGVMGAVFVARRAGIENVITMDMGGTSTDVYLVTGGVPQVTTDGMIDRLPIKVPMIDICSVGAGGGSIARIDPGGMLQVGPQSAGADPGPACYGRGGKRPTTTDANVARGLIRPHRFLGGRKRLDREAGVEVLRELAVAVGQDPGALGESIFKVANATMAAAIRVVSVERGYDPRDYTLVAFGGAGPLHAAAVADDLGITRVLVPVHPGLLSAFGLLIADFRRDYVRTDVRPADTLTPRTLAATFTSLQAEALAEVASHHLPKDRAELIPAADMRYVGQAFELTVPLSAAEVGALDPAVLTDRFHRLHRIRYGHAAPKEAVELVNYRLSVVVPQPKPQRLAAEAGEAQPAETLPVPVDGRSVECRFYWRPGLRAGFRAPGPAVIEEHTATTYVPPGWTLAVDAEGNLRLEREAH